MRWRAFRSPIAKREASSRCEVTIGHTAEITDTTAYVPEIVDDFRMSATGPTGKHKEKELKRLGAHARHRSVSKPDLMGWKSARLAACNRAASMSNSVGRVLAPDGVWIRTRRRPAPVSRPANRMSVRPGMITGTVYSLSSRTITCTLLGVEIESR